jgi:hypothetical protein
MANPGCRLGPTAAIPAMFLLIQQMKAIIGLLFGCRRISAARERAVRFALLRRRCLPVTIGRKFPLVYQARRPLA